MEEGPPRPVLSVDIGGRLRKPCLNSVEICCFRGANDFVRNHHDGGLRPRDARRQSSAQPWLCWQLEFSSARRRGLSVGSTAQNHDCA